MSDNKIALKIVPPKTAASISHDDLVRLSRITKVPLEKVKERVSQNKNIIIITRQHPKLDQVVNTVRSFGFSVEILPAEKYKVTTASAVPPVASTTSARVNSH